MNTFIVLSNRRVFLVDRLLKLQYRGSSRRLQWSYRTSINASLSERVMSIPFRLNRSLSTENILQYNSILMNCVASTTTVVNSLPTRMISVYNAMTASDFFGIQKKTIFHKCRNLLYHLTVIAYWNTCLIYYYLCLPHQATV